MKKILIVIAVILMVSLVGCNKGNKEIKEDNLNEEDLIKFENTDELDFSQVSYVISETKKDENLEEAILKKYKLKEGEVEFEYYYNKIDINGDDKEETFVLV
ncbi:MAG: hypothetical protein FH753_01990 [Firmicutes bacterium]|nr:hypothetical protein [Bacillota bacterium]